MVQAFKTPELADPIGGPSKIVEASVMELGGQLVSGFFTASANPASLDPSQASLPSAQRIAGPRSPKRVNSNDPAPSKNNSYGPCATPVVNPHRDQ
jgi:hypothetical protein